MEQYTITLNNGTEIKDLIKNGDNFVSKVKLDESIFKNNLTRMTISNGEEVEVLENMEFIQQMKIGKEYYICFRQLTEREIKDIEIDSKIEYLAMMSDIEL